MTGITGSSRPVLNGQRLGGGICLKSELEPDSVFSLLTWALIASAGGVTGNPAYGGPRVTLEEQDEQSDRVRMKARCSAGLLVLIYSDWSLKGYLSA